CFWWDIARYIQMVVYHWCGSIYRRKSDRPGGRIFYRDGYLLSFVFLFQSYSFRISLHRWVQSDQRPYWFSAPKRYRGVCVEQEPDRNKLLRTIAGCRRECGAYRRRPGRSQNFWGHIEIQPLLILSNTSERYK